MTRNTHKTSQAKRLDSIRQELLNTGEVSAAQLARTFKVSHMTIHRDIEILEANGEAIRTHGGAAMAKRLTFEFSFRDKQQQNHPKKQKIARQAAELVKNGSVVMLDTGTTTLEIARALIGKKEITIITTSLVIVSELQYSDTIKVILLGGFLRGGSPDMHGPLTEQNVEQFKADIAFMGADAIDASGNTYTNDLRVVNLDKKMASNASKVVITVDSSKFSSTAMCKVLEPGDYDLIITDNEINKKMLNQLKSKKINLDIV
jgi:DeoR/GlpR family transcriptional regulator of sugar metabolism